MRNGRNRGRRRHKYWTLEKVLKLAKDVLTIADMILRIWR